MQKILAATIILAIGTLAYASRPEGNPVEVGHVNWGRDFEAALAMSAQSGKPVLVLFQEVPG